MATAPHDLARPAEPLWIRRPQLLHAVAYAVAALVLAGQLAALVVRGAGVPSYLAVALAGVGVGLSCRWAWPGLLLTSAASFAVYAVGRDPLSVWMMAVLVLFSATLRGRRPLPATAVVAAFLLAAFMSVGGFRGGPLAGSAALFSAVAGGAAGAALRFDRERWTGLVELTEAAIAVRGTEAERRVAEERLRIARDLHDVVGHQVALLSVHLGVAEVGLPASAEGPRQALASARSSARTVVVETQRILALLRRGADGGDDLAPVPGLGGLGALVASYEEAGLDVRSTIDLPAGAADPGVGVTVYRVVQEALTNAHRHGVGPVQLAVRDDGRGVSVLVENDVAGGPTSGGGLGLVGMRERIEAAGGRVTAERRGDRFRVAAEIGVPV